MIKKIIKEPNMVKKYWIWEVTNDKGMLHGKAKTESEAWRLIRDAERQLNKVSMKKEVE